jgi:hypothetical protein
MSTNSYLHIFTIITFLTAGCRDKQPTQMVIIEEEKLLNSIPSASGLAIENDTAWIIGDDATSVYRLNLTSFEQEKIPLKGFDAEQYRLPKPIKHDLECANLITYNNKQYLLAFGSGTLEPYRDSVLLLNTSDTADQQFISVQPFYKELQRLTGTDSTKWNIEGSTLVGDTLIICNRGNNLLISFHADSLMHYLLFAGTPIPAIDFHKANLPQIEGKEARLSGICTLNDNHLLFSAAVEDTPDWVKDGPILGSFIGIYSLKEKKVLASHLLRDKQGAIAKEKLESIDIVSKQGGTITCIAMADNDNGTSGLYRLKLIMP